MGFLIEYLSTSGEVHSRGPCVVKLIPEPKMSVGKRVYKKKRLDLKEEAKCTHS